MSVSREDLNAGRINDDLETKLAGVSAQMEANVERSRNALADWRASLSDQATSYGKELDRQVNEYPWRSITVAFFGAMLLGILCGAECGTSRRR